MADILKLKVQMSEEITNAINKAKRSVKCKLWKRAYRCRRNK